MRPRQISGTRPLQVTMVLALMLALAGCGQDQNGARASQGPGNGQPPAPVSYVTVRSQDVRVEADYTARLYGSREAEVRARVSGILEERLYREGEFVDQDAPLFRIDPAPYRIALQRAEAERANARAALSQAERERRRIEELFHKGAISERDRDLASSEQELTKARLDLAEAGVAQARLDLGYTTVRAPVAGVTGLEALTPGNLVAHGDLLTTVTQLDPIHARFALPGEDAAARRAVAGDLSAERLAARLLLADGQRYEHTGPVDFTASTVDARTGNVVARAVFDNPDGRLAPGSLARVRVTIGQLEAVYLVDPQAVSQGAAGPVLFVVDEHDTARARNVRLGPLVDGQQVVLEGLADGDRVIVNGQVALRDGATVMPKPREQQAD